MEDIAELLLHSDQTVLMFFALFMPVFTLVTYMFKLRVDMKVASKENDEIEQSREKISIVMSKDEDASENSSKEQGDTSKNVIAMMIDNVGELREYYVISKQQARRSFSASLFICFFGIVIYVLGIVAYVFLNKNISAVSIIAGTVVEVISALFFWLYREATKQLSIYHQRLGSTEKYLIAIQIIKDMQTENKTFSCNKLLEAILMDNREIIKHENGK